MLRAGSGASASPAPSPVTVRELSGLAEQSRTRDCCFSENTEDIADRSSLMDLRKNADVTLDIYFGPKAPAGYEKHWIPTVRGRGWFTYVRLYRPTEASFDNTTAPTLS